MHSIVLLVITYSTLLNTVPIATVPISAQVDTELGSAEPGDAYTTSSSDAESTETSQSNLVTSELTNSGSPSTNPEPKATDAPSEDTDASIEEHKATDGSTTTAPVTTKEPQSMQPPTTNTPPVNCKDLDMEAGSKYPSQLGDVPKSLGMDERVLPINAISKLLPNFKI